MPGRRKPMLSTRAASRREGHFRVIERTTYPEDRPRLAAVSAGLDPAGTGDWAVEFRIVRPDGTMRWASFRCRAVFAGEGEARRAVQVVGTIQDITERKLAEQALRAERARLQAVLDHVPVGVLLAEAPSGRLVLSNRRLKEICRYPILDAPELAALEWEGYDADGRRVTGRELPLAITAPAVSRPNARSTTGAATAAWPGCARRAPRSAMQAAALPASSWPSPTSTRSAMRRRACARARRVCAVLWRARRSRSWCTPRTARWSTSAAPSWRRPGTTEGRDRNDQGLDGTRLRRRAPARGRGRDRPALPARSPDRRRGVQDPHRVRDRKGLGLPVVADRPRRAQAAAGGEHGADLTDRRRPRSGCAS